MEQESSENLHVPVLLEETLSLLDPQLGDLIVDATLGLGGHTEALLTRYPEISVIGIDQDERAIELASQRLTKFGDRVRIVHSNFENIRNVAARDKVNAILADLGVSSMQLDDAPRGFSFRYDAPLDMRMDASEGNPTAAELLKDLDEESIANIIYQYGEERFSRRIAKRIVAAREAGEPVETTKRLAELVERSVPRSKKDKIHPATRTFQALRIAVNREIEILEAFLRDSVDLLAADGRLAVISFHSLEDRIVKQTFQKLSGKCFCPPRMPRCECGAAKKVEILTKKPVVASDDETLSNPRSRSAKLRAVRKLA